ncbi:MAG: hypothetical protein KAT70_06590, partial [Thermoplasmata archaeon]|nr:hypothetical protein [Thermoplasmata archaeon]
TVIWLMEKMLVSYGTDPELTALVDSRDIWFVPVLNPDGREKSLDGTGCRKNMRDNGDGTYGVDLNRNFDDHWGTTGTNHNPGSSLYCGPYPFSEPETRAIRDNLTALYDIDLVLSYHSHGQLVLYPWGYDATQPEDEEALSTIAGEMAALSGAGWVSGQASDPSIGMYDASGDLCDWFYANDTFAFTVEMSTSDIPMDPASEAVSHFPSFLYALEIADDPSSPKRKEWTVAVYLAADDDALHDALLDDLNELESQPIPSGVSVVALFDGKERGDTWLYEIEQDPLGMNSVVYSTGIRPPEVIPGGEVNTGDPGTLEDFVSWVVRTHPARNTMLVLGGHGKGIFKGLCPDLSSSNDFLKLPEMSAALDAALGEEKLAIVGLDVCWLGSLETAIELAPHTQNIIFSQDEELLDGWNYADLMHRLNTDPDISPRDLAEGIVEDYWNNVHYVDATVSALSISRLTSSFLPLWDLLALSLSAEYYYNNLSILGAAEGVESYTLARSDKDAIGFFEGLEASTLPDGLRDLATRTKEALASAIFAERHAASHTGTHGASIYLPSTAYDPRYDNLRAGDRPWATFVGLYNQEPVETPRIEHQPLSGLLEAEESFTLSFVVEDDNLLEAVVWYINGSGIAYSIPMEVEGDRGEIVIPGQSPGTNVSY